MEEASAVGRREFLAVAGGAATAAGTGGTGRAAVDPELAAKSGRVDGVVRFEDGADVDSSNRQEVRRALKDHAASTQRGFLDRVRETDGVEIRRQFWLANAVLVTVDTDRVSFAELVAIEGVDRIHRTVPESGRSTGPDRRDSEGVDAGTAQSDRAVSYGLEMMNVPAVWDRFDTRGEGARIAVVDTGVDPSHPDIDLDAWAEFDAAGERVDSDPHDPEGHGTGMSSLATGGDASGTYVGVAPEADLLVARLSSEDFFASSVAALEWAVENDADVVSMSFEFGPLRHDAIEPISNAIAAGTVVTASGVVDPGAFFAPGSLYHTLSTGVVDSDRTPFRGGNGGEIRTDRYWRSDAVPDDWPDRYTIPDVVAAGVDVLAAVPDNDEYDGGHRRASGYSNGPPHVAGVVALLRSLDGDLPPEGIGRILTETAEQPGGPFEHPPVNGDFGNGLVNAAAAAAEVRGRDREVSGRVTDPDGDPVPAATVSAVTGDRTRTDDRGRYTLPVPPGEAALTASAVGYDPVRRRVDPGDGSDLTFESERRPDIRLAARPPTRVAPGDTAAVEFVIEHAEFATVLLDDGGGIDRSAVSARANGDPITLGEPTDVSGQRRLRIELDVEDGVRGRLQSMVSLADGSRNASVEPDAIHVHERPMQVAEDESLREAIEAAAPGTGVVLAGDRWDLDIEPFESPFPASRFDNPVFETSRDDEAGLLVDKPVVIAAGEGYDPTLVASGGSGDRRFGIQVTSHFATVDGVEVVADGATAAVSVLDGDGVRLRNLTLSGAENGVIGQFTKSLAVQSSRITAARAGVVLRDLSVNALVRDTEIRDADRGVFLSGLVGDEPVEVDADVYGNSFENVARGLDGEGPVTVRGEDGRVRQVGGEPPGDSVADLLLYAATAAAVGALFYPYGRRRFG